MVKLRNWGVLVASFHSSPFFLLFCLSYYFLRRYTLNVEYYVQLIGCLRLLCELLNLFLAAIPRLIIILEILVLGCG